MRLAVLLLALCLGGCIRPQSSGARLIEAAHEVVTAARFGRMDLVLMRVKGEAREKFALAHAQWGGNIRILDIEYGGVTPVSDQSAMVLMTVNWTRLDETTVRTTILKQTWSFGEETWEIAKEEIAEGDAKLLNLPDPELDGDAGLAAR